MTELKPMDLQLGNFINCFGGVVLVTGITPRPDGTFFIHHSGENQTGNPFGDGILFDAYPIKVTDQWLKALNVDKYKFPSWIKYVHEVQNYVRWYCGVDLLPNVNWDAIPTTIEFEV